MSRAVAFLSAARDDIGAAYDWYELRTTGLGLRFLIAVEQAIRRLGEHPEGYERVADEFRRIILQRFPYSIFYEVSENQLTIYGVLHHAEDPAKWQSRLSHRPDTGRGA